MTVVLGYNEDINKIADILGVPQSAKDWSLHVHLEEAVRLKVYGYLDLDDKANEALKKTPHTFRMERVVKATINNEEVFLCMCCQRNPENPSRNGFRICDMCADEIHSNVEDSVAQVMELDA